MPFVGKSSSKKRTHQRFPLKNELEFKENHLSNQPKTQTLRKAKKGKNRSSPVTVHTAHSDISNLDRGQSSSNSEWGLDVSDDMDIGDDCLEYGSDDFFGQKVVTIDKDSEEEVMIENFEKINAKKRPAAGSASKRESNTKKARLSEQSVAHPLTANGGKNRSRPVSVLHAALSDATSDSSSLEEDEASGGSERGLRGLENWDNGDDLSEYGDDNLLEKETDGIVEDREFSGKAETLRKSSTHNSPALHTSSHKEQKLLTQQRRGAKPYSSLLTEAKRIWSLVQQKKCSDGSDLNTFRRKHVAELMGVVRGNVKEIVFRHDASRIIQTILKYGGQNERGEVAQELKGHYKELVQNKYSRFIVLKLIRFCPGRRASILMEFRNRVLKLLLHREATSVLANAFDLYANAYERSILLSDFYGKEATLFGMTSGSGADKERLRKGFNGFLEGASEERKNRLMKSLKESLMNIFNSPDKGAVAHAIVHRALLEYVNALHDVTDSIQKEKLEREIFVTCEDSLAEIVHTKDGSRVARQFIARGSAKDRKQILKVLKPHVGRMCSDNEAQLVLFTALDVIDDTKLLSKSIVSEITAAATKLHTSPQGRRALLYLLIPRTKRHFTPAQIAILSETDDTRAETSKKDAAMRESEIRKSASEALISWVEQQVSSLVRDPCGTVLMTDIMLFSEGDKAAATRSLLRQISSEYPSIPPLPLHPMDLPHTSRMYKTLLQGGHFIHASKAIDCAPAWNAGEFASEFVRTVGEATSVATCTRGEGNGAFVVAELCQALVREKGREVERQEVKGWFGDEVQRAVAEGPAKGKKVLMEKLTAL